MAIDNTAVVHVLRNGYASTKEGRAILDEILQLLELHDSTLEPVNVPGRDNVADSPSRFLRLKAECIRSTWKVLADYEGGRGKQSQTDEYIFSNVSTMNDGCRHCEPSEDPAQWLADAAEEAEDEDTT